MAGAKPTEADPLSDKRAEAARLEAQLNEQGRQASIAAEQFNQAQLKLDAIRGEMEQARADLDRADERTRVVRAHLAEAAIAAYTHGGDTAILSRLASSAGGSETVLRSQYLRIASNDRQRVLGELRRAKQDLSGVREHLQGREAAAKTVTDEAEAQRRAAEGAEANERVLLSQAKGDLATLVAAETARREQEQARAAPPPAAPPAKSTVAAEPAAKPRAQPQPATPPPTSSGAAAAVAEAQRQIGKPYVWGGSGPDSFDCSGLTAWAWRAGGVGLSHSAVAQYNETTRVPTDEVQPGDLLFFGSSPSTIHHNAIYVGDGQMIEASQSGTPVRYRGWRAGDLVGIGRPG